MLKGAEATAAAGITEEWAARVRSVAAAILPRDMGSRDIAMAGPGPTGTMAAATITATEAITATATIAITEAATMGLDTTAGPGPTTITDIRVRGHSASGSAMGPGTGLIIRITRATTITARRITVLSALGTIRTTRMPIQFHRPLPCPSRT